MGRIRRGGYVFVTWVGDHAPRHVHVFVDQRLVAKWDLDEWKCIAGLPGGRVVQLLEELRQEGKL